MLVTKEPIVVQIRHAKIEDLGALLELLPQLTSRPESAGAKVPDRRTALDILTKMIENPYHHLLVAVETENLKVIGSVTLTITLNLTYGGRPRADIEGMIVHQDYRRLGVGTRLVRHAESLASNCYREQVVSGNKPEQLAFYKSLGFDTDGYVAHRKYP